MEPRLADSVEFDSVVTSGPLRASGSMRSINTSMRQVSGSYALADPIAFFCECEIPTCYSVVWMSASSFDATVEDESGWLLAEAHTPSQLRPVQEPSSGATLSPAAEDAALDRCAQ
jgi:hypothetical protein